ncbi:hypothetical protein SRIMM317S_04983 [Streptomyces rimosus subsp. rimosus]
MDTSGPAWTSLTVYETVGVGVLLLRRRLPTTAFVVGFGALFAALVGSAGAGAKLSPLVFLPLAVLLYSLGNHVASWRRTVSAVLGVSVLSVAGLWLNRMTTDSGDFQGGLDVLAALAPMPLAWGSPRGPGRNSWPRPSGGRPTHAGHRPWRGGAGHRNVSGHGSPERCTTWSRTR